MDKRLRAGPRPTSSSSSSAHRAVPALDNFLQVLPPERSYSAAPSFHANHRGAAAVRSGSLAKPSRGVIVTETVKKAAYALSSSCVQLEQLVLHAAEFQYAQPSDRTDASNSSRSTSAPPPGFFFTGVPAFEECSTTKLDSPYAARSQSAAAIIPRSQSQPMSPSSPDVILQPKQYSPPVSSVLIQDMQNLEDANVWCGRMLSEHQLQVALASLDLSDEEDVDAGDQAAEALNDHNEHGDHEQCFAEDAAANESLASFDAARFAVVEGLQLLLSSMQSAVDEQGRPLMSQAELHLAAEAEEDRLLAERADAEVVAMHEQQQLELDLNDTVQHATRSIDSSAETQSALSSNNSNDDAAPCNVAPASAVTAGLSFAVDCLGDEWAPSDETAQQRHDRHLKRAGIIKIMELDNQLCAVRQRHRIISRTLASASGQTVSPTKRRAASSASSALFSEKDRRLHQRLQRAAEMCRNIEAPQLVSALQVKEEARVAELLGDGAVPHFGYDDSQQQRLLDIDRELLRMAAPEVVDEPMASFGTDTVSSSYCSTPSGTKARADAEASRFLQHEQQHRQEQARIKDVNAQLRSIMELERLTVHADATPPHLPPGCRLVPKSRDGSAPLVVVASASAIQELLLDIRRADSLGHPSALSRPSSACSVLSAATAELDALLASRSKISASNDRFDLQSETSL